MPSLSYAQNKQHIYNYRLKNMEKVRLIDLKSKNKRNCIKPLRKYLGIF